LEKIKAENEKQKWIAENALKKCSQKRKRRDRMMVL